MKKQNLGFALIVVAALRSAAMSYPAYPNNQPRRLDTIV
jgi:hypothetical protein